MATLRAENTRLRADLQRSQQSLSAQLQQQQQQSDQQQQQSRPAENAAAAAALQREVHELTVSICGDSTVCARSTPVQSPHNIY